MSEQTNTPRTNAVCSKNFHDDGPKSSAPQSWLCRESAAGEIADHARTLERELSAAEQRAEAMRKALVIAEGRLCNGPARDAVRAAIASGAGESGNG